MKAFCVAVCLISGFFVRSQDELPLEIGQKAPDTILAVIKTVSKVFENNKEGRSFVIDFFSSSCVVCFQNLPKVKKLQQQFNNKIQFVLWGYEDGDIQSVYEKFQKKLNLDLPVLFDSSIFIKIKKESVPTYLWIDQEGIVQAVTDPEYLNETNLEKFLTGNFSYDMRQAPKKKFDRLSPYLVNQNGGDESDCLFRSLLGYWNDSLPRVSFLKLNYFQDRPLFQALGIHMSSLYYYAYFGAIEYWNPQSPFYGKVWPKPVIKYKRPGAGTGLNIDSLFCYSLYIPLKNKSERELQKFMQNDLDNYFGFKVRIVTKEMPCWYLVRCRGKKFPKSKYDKSYQSRTYTGFEYRKMTLQNLRELIYYFFENEPPFIDQTGIDYPIDLRVEALLTDFNDFKLGLRKAGLDLKKGTAPMKVMELSKD